MSAVIVPTLRDEEASPAYLHSSSLRVGDFEAAGEALTMPTLRDLNLRAVLCNKPLLPIVDIAAQALIAEHANSLRIQDARLVSNKLLDAVKDTRMFNPQRTFDECKIHNVGEYEKVIHGLEIAWGLFGIRF